MITYNYCRICGHTPQNKNDEPNHTRRFWDPDDGWVFGALCRYCWNMVKHAEPHPDDYAYPHTNHICDDLDTDEDPLAVLDELS